MAPVITPRVSAIITGCRGIAYAAAKKLIEARIVNDIVFLSRDERIGKEQVATLLQEVQPKVETATVQHISFDLHGGPGFDNICKQLESWPDEVKVLVN